MRKKSRIKDIINNGTITANLAGATTSVSVVPSASILTNAAFHPNPVNVSVLVGTVTWVNDDLVPHTVTSGQNG